MKCAPCRHGHTILCIPALQRSKSRTNCDAMDIKQLIQLKTQRVSALKAVIDDDILYAVNNAPPTAEEFEQEQSNRLQRPLLRIQGKSIIMADILEQAARVCKLFSGLGPFCSVFVRTVPNLFGCWGHEILFAWTGDADSGAAS